MEFIFTSQNRGRMRREPNAISKLRPRHSRKGTNGPHVTPCRHAGVILYRDEGHVEHDRRQLERSSTHPPGSRLRRCHEDLSRSEAPNHMLTHQGRAPGFCRLHRSPRTNRPSEQKKVNPFRSMCPNHTRLCLAKSFWSIFGVRKDGRTTRERSFGRAFLLLNSKPLTPALLPQL